MSSSRRRLCECLELRCTLKNGLAAVQNGTAMLVKVIDFQYLVYNLKCWTAWTVKVEAVICCECRQLYSGQHGVISGENLMFSISVENTPEYYRNVLFLLMLKGTFSLYNLRAYLYVNNVSSNVWYLHQYLVSNCHNSVLTPHSFWWVR